MDHLVVVDRIRDIIAKRTCTAAAIGVWMWTEPSISPSQMAQEIANVKAK
jgi:hypothetical protein